MTALSLRDGAVAGLRVRTAGSESLLPCRRVILAIGHSARDTVETLYEQGLRMERKAFAMGVRVEHPQALINLRQLGPRVDTRLTGSAEYFLTAPTLNKTCSAYSFCMCPGGIVVPAASGPEQIVVNGMSPSQRNSPWSNSGMVVELHAEDLADPTLMEKGTIQDLKSPLAMMEFQEYLERIAWIQGNRRQTAPAQRMSDFVNRRLSYDLPNTSYAAGLISTPIHFWMPQFITSRLKQGFLNFGKSSHGFLTNEATMIGADAIVNVRYSTSALMANAAEIIAYGTAVRFKK